MSKATDGLLVKAADLYRQCRGNYRDVMLEVGGTLRQYLARREQELSKSGMRRFGSGYSETIHSKCLREIHESLGVSVEKARVLMAASAAVELLDSHLGTLSWSTVRKFGQAVRRRADGSWELRRDCKWAPQLLEAAVINGWTEGTIQGQFKKRLDADRARRNQQRQETRRMPGQHKTPEKGYATPRTKDGPSTATLATIAAPADLAEMICDMVLKSRDPEMVKSLLLKELPNLRVPRPTLSFK
jgi:hypothetical protein